MGNSIGESKLKPPHAHNTWRRNSLLVDTFHWWIYWHANNLHSFFDIRPSCWSPMCSIDMKTEKYTCTSRRRSPRTLYSCAWLYPSMVSFASAVDIAMVQSEVPHTAHPRTHRQSYCVRSQLDDRARGRDLSWPYSANHAHYSIEQSPETPVDSPEKPHRGCKNYMFQ